MGLKRDGIRKSSNDTANKDLSKKVETLGLSNAISEKTNKEKEKVKEIVEEVMVVEEDEIIEVPSKPINEPIEEEDEVIEEIIEEPVKTPPEPSDEVIDASDDKPNKITEEELKKILEEEENKTDEDRQVICLDTLEVYTNSKEASAKTGANAGAITRNCNGNCKRAGGKRWQYYKDYLLENR